MPPGHLWSDLMQRHGETKFHLQVGGGDQVRLDSAVVRLQLWCNVWVPRVPCLAMQWLECVVRHVTSVMRMLLELLLVTLLDTLDAPGN